MNRQTDKQQTDTQTAKQQTDKQTSSRSDRQMDQQSPRAADQVHGEGNYEASRRFNREEKAFVESGKVEDAARKAAPDSAQAAKEMEQAEQVGKSRAKAQDRPDAMARAPKDSGADE
ncbi:MAG TPA: hypothetical protein PKA20_07525 [Burkholderiaceae bacterium]|nr:hypothetical protein [Burkholderiaceae bacterium]